MTRADLARPVVIKMDSDLGEDIIRSNMQTLGLNRTRFEELLEQVRRKGGAKKRSKNKQRKRET
jgi:hypothetical protein